MSDSYGPSPYGPSDRRQPSGPWDHHAEVRDQWGDEPPEHRLPEPHGGPPSWVDEPTGHQATGRHDRPLSEPYDPWGSDGLPLRRAGEPGEGDSWAGGPRSGDFRAGDPRAGGPRTGDPYQLSPGWASNGHDGRRSGAVAGRPEPETPEPEMPEPETPEPETGGRHAGRSPRLVTGGAAAAVVLVLVAAAATFTMHRKSDPGTADAALNQGAPTQATDDAGPDNAYPSIARPTTKPSPKVSKSAGGKAAATKATGPAKSVGGVPAPPVGFTLTFGDSFDGSAGSGLGSKYRYDTGPGSKFGTGEIETMTDSTRNVFHDGAGHLVLKALHSGNDPRNGWTSGRFETRSDAFGAPPGGKVRMQASIEQPNVTRSTGAGYWPAFWMLGNGLRDGGTWPKIGEVDILEDINGRSSVFGTLHCGTNPGGPCGESTGIGSGEKACGGCQTGFHTYAVEIDRSSSPEKIRWFLDGRNYFTISQDRVDRPTWSNAVDHPFFIIFDLAMGGGFPDAFGGGPTSSTVSGGQMKIDYVAVYNSH
jgi:beta-glucanase (GH16 family)